MLKTKLTLLNLFGTFRCLITVLSLFCTISAQNNKGGGNENIPHLRKTGNVTQLIVDNKPFLILGGELHNSSSSSLEYMKPIWSKLTKMHLNTALAVVSWEQIEPTEGNFNFAVVDGLIQEAKNNGLRLTLLWFGSWKNGNSRYPPPWVKADQKRFPRVRNKDGKTLEILSPLNDANREADARAFAALMKRIREVDSARTVIMMQVENEVGVLGDSRDRTDAANAAFAKPVPKELMNYLARNKNTLSPKLRQVWEAAGSKTSGTWTEIFGQTQAADEIFMAWNYARYLNRVTEAGKTEYPLPMFVNAWIVQPEDRMPGDYPSGGPQEHLHDVWRVGAPQIDILAPDIYLPEFPEILASYSRNGNPILIPESMAGAKGVANAFYAVGQHHAIGYSPFGIESRETDPENGALSKGYAVLAQLTPLILEHQTKNETAGVWLNKANPAQKVRLGSYILDFNLRRNRRNPNELPELGYAIVIATAPDEYIIAGTDTEVIFSPQTTDKGNFAGLATVEEGIFNIGRWIPGRLLNGDEVQLRYDYSIAAQSNQSAAGLRFGANGPTIQRVKLYRYQ
ncbi:MAG: DUF5597 domain-containing protein [Acidobacteriota bacterium]|nr:DUF5597 domain-containing protein [Acidobacteriota bacterium]